MTGDGVRSIVDVAQSETIIHVQYMRKSIMMNLLFTFFTIVAAMVSTAIAVSTGWPAHRIEEVLFLVPPPILFIALAISIAVQIRLLRRIEGSISDMTKGGNGTLNMDSRRATKSVANVNYEIVAAMYKSLRIWPIVALLFILFFVGSIVGIIEWLFGLSSDATFDDATALNGITLLFAVIFFWIQTTQWLNRRRKLDELELMEMTVMDELHL